MAIFRINRPHEETIEFFVDDESVGTVTHDEHGWSAMDDVQCLFERVANRIGAEIVRTEDRE
jgi:hypothetical protein